MRNLVFESAVQKILKKILLVVISSGLITNALYIYGLSYYEGYIGNMGFEYDFFPIKWDETLLWTYVASRDLGASTVSFWTKLTGPVMLLILVVSYFVARIWMAINAQGLTSNRRVKRNFFLARFIVRLRANHPKAFRIIYPPVRWFLIMEQSIWAFLASYFVLIVLFFIPLLIFIWVYFPLIGLSHGEKVGVRQFEIYKKELCGRKNEYWNKCLKFSTSHLKDKDLPETIYGRVIVKNGLLVGLITPDGPVTMTMPAVFYQKSEKNKCYKLDCNK